MKKVFIYQIVDDLSENVLQNFIGPNDAFAENVFANFCNSKGMKNVDLDDIYMLRREDSTVCETYSDFSPMIDVYNSDATIDGVWCGSEFAACEVQSDES